VNGTRPANYLPKVRVLPKKDRPSRKRQELQRLLQPARQKPIFRRIPETRLSEESIKEDNRKRANQFAGWIKCRAQSFGHAGRGLGVLWRTQWNFRIHLIAGLGAICLACYFQISAVEWLFLVVAIALVLSAEALNTAIERTVDLVEPKRNPWARDAKDLAAAAVLIASLCSLIVGIILFGPRLCGLLFR
jgi:diacylglycerol kinase